MHLLTVFNSVMCISRPYAPKNSCIILRLQERLYKSGSFLSRLSRIPRGSSRLEESHFELLPRRDVRATTPCEYQPFPPHEVKIRTISRRRERHRLARRFSSLPAFVATRDAISCCGLVTRAAAPGWKALNQSSYVR